MILDILKLKKKGNNFYLILAILADLETRLDSWSCQIRSLLGTLNIGFGGTGVFWHGFRHLELKKKKKVEQNLFIWTEFENRLDLPGPKLLPLVIKLPPWDP
ncbi:unnamed protein product [Meganyctiphanes norvegica]|uniref:Uncharacterized protein n=1 Tax=Meganyctiphanes norvegica TaxID=48144 RepID=A0AAV2QYH2_MEGNR